MVWNTVEMFVRLTTKIFYLPARKFFCKQLFHSDPGLGSGLALELPWREVLGNVLSEEFACNMRHDVIMNHCNFRFTHHQPVTSSLSHRPDLNCQPIGSTLLTNCLPLSVSYHFSIYSFWKFPFWPNFSSRVWKQISWLLVTPPSWSNCSPARPRPCRGRGPRPRTQPTQPRPGTTLSQIGEISALATQPIPGSQEVKS